MGFSISKKHLLQHDSTTINDFTDRTSTKNKKKFKEGDCDTIIMHYTAGRSALSSANHLANKDVKASAHLVVGREGEVYQLVPFDTISWHAGVSSYRGRHGYNKYSIGIEIDNAGILTKVGSQYQAWFGKKYPESEVIRATHRNEQTPRYWQSYTEVQIEAVRQIVEVLLPKYNISQILGHEEISPGRKQDPGPAFDLDRFRNTLLGANRSSDDQTAASKPPTNGKVDVDKLNIRQGPGSAYEKIAKPLKKEQEVAILDEENGWYKVETKVTG